MPDCSCQWRPAEHMSGRCRGYIGKYVIRLDVWDDGTTFDPACPFHGDRGTQVAVLRPTSQLPLTPDLAGREFRS